MITNDQVISEKRGHPTEGRKTMTTHKTGTREHWLTARLELLQAEKKLTRRSDELARRRQELPWVRIDKEYRFETDEGSASLSDPLPRPLAAPHLSLHVRNRLHGRLCDLLDDRGRLQRVRDHLANHDVMLWAVSQAPFEKLQAYKQRMGWTFPWHPRTAATSTSGASSPPKRRDGDEDIAATKEHRLLHQLSTTCPP
jgi:predicted dithiol-disulfide oxidoreductase (DUF899 family)